MSLPAASDMASDTSSIMSEMTQYTLALNPEDWEEEWNNVIDGGEVDEETVYSCPQCKQVFQGKKENYNTWVARHIRLHNVQGIELDKLMHLLKKFWMTYLSFVLQEEEACFAQSKT